VGLLGISKQTLELRAKAQMVPFSDLEFVEMISLGLITASHVLSALKLRAL